jgi:GT2 family glycosyltransferase
MAWSFDIVTVYHNDAAFKDSLVLEKQVTEHASFPFHVIGVDNRVENRGFSAACNLGTATGSSPIIGFLNPDCVITGDFMTPVVEMFETYPLVVITGERFGKGRHELRVWGCHDWVCGACLFVRRDFWESVGGFDNQFFWAWEETDLIRQAQKLGFRVKSLNLPVHHESPSDDSFEVGQWKNKWFDIGARRFYAKWGSSVTRR